MSKLPDTAPAYVQNEGSTRLSLSGLNHTTLTSLSTLRRVSCPTATQDSLPAAGPAFRAGLVPAGSQRKVSEFKSLPPFQSLPDARTFLIVAASCPVCGEPVCLHRSTYQNNYECPLCLPTNEITRTTSPDSLVYKPNDLTGHQASIDLVLVSAPPALMATFTASSIGSLKGTSIRSRPCS